MRKMRERIMTDGWRRGEGTLSFSLKQVELFPAPGEKVEGFFEITGGNESVPEGFVRSSDERMQCLTPYFSGSKDTIEYRFDADGMLDNDTRSGRFFVVSNCGEYVLPWKIRVQKRALQSSMGEIHNLFHFTNLARANWREAVKFFYTREFKQICGEEQEDLFNLYRGLAGDYGNEANVEEFLIAVNKKQPIGFSALQKEIRIPDMKGRISEDILISRNGWGPVRLNVEVQGDFVSVEKSWLTEDDFLGNQCRVPVFLDDSRMHEGRNFGQVTFTYFHGSFTVPIVVERRTLQSRAKEKRNHEWKKYNCRMVKLYQEYRMKRIDMDTWRSKARDCVEHMAHLSDRSVVPKLFSAQLLMTEDKMEEAGWILERVKPWMAEADPAVVCYYLYLTTLYNREDNYVRRVTQKVQQVYQQNPGEWRIAWLLLFLSGELNRSAAKKWTFLENQFKAGCSSPVLYLEALLLLNAGPTLAAKLDPVLKRLLAYGSRNGLLGPDLMGHVIYLINREKYFDPVLFEVLKASWEKRRDTETLQAICTLLIKGGKTGKEYYSWYLMGVQKKLRITRLYEHYLMSVDLGSETELPKIVLLYFAYQSNLDYEYAAYLYAYVERHREEDADLYITYKPQIDRFVLTQLFKGRINRDLAYLYRRVLTGSELTAENAGALASLLSSVEITCSRDKKRLVAVHARLKGEKIYAPKDGRAYVDIYSSQDLLFTEDEYKNRHLVNQEAKRFFLFPEEDFKREVAGLAREEIKLHLSLTDVEQVTVRADNADSYLAISGDSELSSVYGQKVRIALLRFFFEEERTEELDQLLKKTELDDIATADRTETIRYLVLQGFYEKAFVWLKGSDIDKQDARILMRLCSRLLEQQLFTEEERMTALCFSTAIRGKYDGLILQQLTERYEGSIGEMEAIRNAAEGFGINTYPLCERIMEQMLFTGRDVTERMDLLRQYVSEGGRSELEIAFLHRCAYSYVLEKQPIHVYMIHDMLRLYRMQEPVTDICRLACLQYYAKNRDAMDESTERVIQKLAERFLQENKVLPVLKEFADIVPGAELLLDKSFVVYHGRMNKKAILNYRILEEEDISEDYKSVEMLHIFEGIYISAFILFPGQTLQYFVTETGEMKEIADSGLLKAEECSGIAARSRYGMLSAVTARMLSGEKLRNGEWDSLELLNQYLHTDYCVNRLFEALE